MEKAEHAAAKKGGGTDKNQWESTELHIEKMGVICHLMDNLEEERKQSFKGKII